jgi:hypothetical protein
MRIGSPELVRGLCVTNSRQLNQFKRLTPLLSRSIYRSEQIATNSSGKVVTKWRVSSDEIEGARKKPHRGTLRVDNELFY